MHINSKIITLLRCFAIPPILFFVYYIYIVFQLLTGTTEVLTVKEKHPENLYIIATHNNSNYGAPYSKNFFNKARIGDVLKTKMNGFATLERNGQVIAKQFSYEIIISIIYSSFLLVPALIFISRNRIYKKKWLLILVGLVELIIIIFVGLPVILSFFTRPVIYQKKLVPGTTNQYEMIKVKSYKEIIDNN